MKCCSGFLGHGVEGTGGSLQVRKGKTCVKRATKLRWWELFACGGCQLQVPERLML